MKCDINMKLAVTYSLVASAVELILLLSRSGRDVNCDHVRALRQQAKLVQK